ncbi:hypothetical protein GCM10010129_09630 [Streptomyces fumigatiscleroticus]|nr:hypothetical protein GCM10010129_09630 [Streptomyces fumigatiscleroticus]
MTASARVPFPVVDEVARHCLREEEPETVHIEVHLPGRPDPARLRKAFAEALLRHPRALVREAPGPWYRRRYTWQPTAEPDVDPVSFPPPGPNAVRAARARALAQAPPLSVSPPVRLEVAAGAGTGSVLFLTLNHTALDAPSGLRILATAAERYGGGDNEGGAHGGGVNGSGDNGGGDGFPAAPPARRPAPPPYPVAAPSPFPWSRPARIAPGAPAPSPGDGLLLTELPLPHRPEGVLCTVNDQLLAATALTLARWNREHGVRPRPLLITMPVDDRARDADMPLGNGTRLVDVPFLPGDLAAPGLPHRTAARTRALKAAHGPQLGRAAALLTAPVVPVVWRAALTRALRRVAAPWTSTTVLSNIGRVPYPLDFGARAGRARAVWFSAPARMPRGLTVTAACTAGRLHLALRWSRALLGHEDAVRLGDLIAHHLRTTEVTG